MTDEEKLKKIIAAYTPLDYTQIDLNRKIKDNYIAVEFKDNFCNYISNQWSNIDTTKLHNEMFVTLKTGNNILNFINN